MDGFLSTNPNRVCALLNEFVKKLPDVALWNLEIKKVGTFPNISNFNHLGTVLTYDFYVRRDQLLIVRNTRGGQAKTALFVSSDFKNALLYYDDNHDFFEIREITLPLYQGFRYYALYNNCYMMHSSAVKIGGRCILFCGQSGVGKSTQAELWKKYANAKIVSYDQNCLYFAKDDELMTQTTPWGGKEDLYLDISCPVQYVVLLDKAAKDTVKKLSIAEAYARLYLSNYLFPINEAVDEKNQGLLLRIVRKIPVYYLCCTKTENAVNVLKKELQLY